MNELKIIGWSEWRFGAREATTDHHRELAIQEMRKNNYHWTGEYHQNGEGGVPVFNDGTRLQLSFRGWGSLMADAYPEEVADIEPKWAYCKYAWFNPDLPHIVPKQEDINEDELSEDEK